MPPVSRYAIFVDAGYLFAQGSASLTGRKQQRHTLRLRFPEILQRLKAFGDDRTGGRELLRIYWYDAASGAPSPEQKQLAHADDVKLRLGFLNAQGQQKGVDSLIVTDLISLAQNGAISDAILLSGDEDLRVGVQMAQMHGVRVHLLGIEPSRGSQSILLMQEADTCSEWLAEDVEQVLEHVTEDNPKETRSRPPTLSEDEVSAALEAILAGYDEARVRAFLQDVHASNMIPQELDGRMLRELGRTLKHGALLSAEEKRFARLLMRRKLQEKG